MSALRVWVAAPAAVALIGLVSVAALIYRATSDPSFAVEPGFYDKAVRWDDAARQRARSLALGWSAGVTLEEGGLRVRLADSGGTPIARATVRCEAFPNRRASGRFAVLLTEQDPGEYAAPMTVTTGGSWHVRVRAETGDGTVFTDEQDAAPAPGRAR